MTDITSVAHRSSVAATRRGYALLGMGLIIPGSAQAVHGRRGLGRFALKLWLVLIVLVVLAAVLTLIFRDPMIGFFANSWVLRVLAVLVFAVGLFWALLTVNTWWISRPRRMGATKGVVFSLIACLLATLLTVGTIGVGRAVWATGGALGNIFAGGGNSTQNHGRYNILLLGSDAGPDRMGIRPDSVNLASVDADTGRTVLFGLPRNLENVPFPDSSPMHAFYPDGLRCADRDEERAGECLLNAVYLRGTEHADAYQGVDDPGIQAMIDGVSGVTGLTINYYAMIDMQGFQDLIDAMGGLTMTLNQRVALNVADNVYLEAGANQHLNGYETLWFARTRSADSDYARMQRQRCVMAAMLQQLNPTTVATKFTELAAASGQTIRTSVPSSQIGSLTALALKARALPISSVSFTPPLIDPARPDFALIQQTVASTIAQSEALDSPQPEPAPAATQTADSAPPAGQPAGDAPAATDGAAPADDGGNATGDLDQICSVG